MTVIIVMNAKVIPNANCLKLLMWYLYVYYGKSQPPPAVIFCGNDTIVALSMIRFFLSSLLLFLVCSKAVVAPPVSLSLFLYWFAYTLHSVETSYVYKCNGSTSERFICFRNRCETLTWRFSRFVRLFWSPRKYQKLKFVAIVVCAKGLAVGARFGDVYIANVLTTGCDFRSLHAPHSAVHRVFARQIMSLLCRLYNTVLVCVYVCAHQRTASGWKTKRIKQLNYGDSLCGVPSCFARATLYHNIIIIIIIIMLVFAGSASIHSERRQPGQNMRLWYTHSIQRNAANNYIHWNKSCRPSTIIPV